MTVTIVSVNLLESLGCSCLNTGKFFGKIVFSSLQKAAAQSTNARLCRCLYTTALALFLPAGFGFRFFHILFELIPQ